MKWLALVAAALGIWLAKRAQDAADSGSSFDIASEVEDMVNTVLPVRALTWSPDVVPVQYRAAIAQAEQANAIPSNMLARLLYQESHFRADIISGAKASPAGALGIAQFMPATAEQLGIDALDPMQAIPAAGEYLSGLYDQLGSWALALAAYNWGIGNVKRRGLAAAPAETQAYYQSILSDVGLSA